MNTASELIEQLLSSYQALDHAAMAACYHDEAVFSDIAFRLDGKRRIHAMWHMICEKGIDVHVESVETDGDVVRARLVDTYVFSDTGRTVVNKIESAFEFRDGLIATHRDACDALDWARQAFGGWKGEIAGRIGLIRRRAARKKMRSFIASHPEYA
ncbi:MAG: nuclear transport factor 2 family protein [Pirellulaceae bacterium]|nr:nuclear transport factor 2 family protein [Pirellulaceae bacterium]